MHKICFAVLLGTLLSASVHADVYQWRDESGRLVYGDQPPPGINATLVRSHPASGATGAARSAAPAATSEQATEEGSSLSRSEREAIAKRTREQEESRKRACDETRNYLAALESGQRVARFNEKGERVFMDDKDRLQTIERTRATLRDNCSK